ncbi:hypothetical protein GT030_18855 [Streptomyces sp. SID1328]|uniref:hypothetical protein n=1 Tax=Streptomyces sp. SID1328 TaxID=2690250 RepID=UPI00136C2AA4|nr:hypothetical protein [Streptomyces sp. SID1328]MYV40869.1 hypothetical protein [Streptomyces sp. SID1328]
MNNLAKHMCVAVASLAVAGGAVLGAGGAASAATPLSGHVKSPSVSVVVSDHHRTGADDRGAIRGDDRRFGRDHDRCEVWGDDHRRDCAHDHGRTRDGHHHSGRGHEDCGVRGHEHRRDSGHDHRGNRDQRHHGDRRDDYRWDHGVSYLWDRTHGWPHGGDRDQPGHYEYDRYRVGL